MPSFQVLEKKLKKTRVGKDEKECIVNLYGYPLRPDENTFNQELADGEKPPVINQIEKTKPNIIAIQIDPMKYLHSARTFALNTIPYMKDSDSIDTKGVFGDNYKLPEE